MYDIKVIFLISILTAVFLYFMVSKNYLVAKPVHEQGLRNGEYSAVFQTGLVTENDNITGYFGDTSLYSSRKVNYVNPKDTSIIEPKSELLDINPVHYLSTPKFPDMVKSMEEKPPLPVASDIKI